MLESPAARAALCAALAALPTAPSRAQDVPTLRVGGAEVPRPLVAREALRLFAAPALEDLSVRLRLEQMCQILARAGRPVPARSIDAPIATNEWIDKLFFPAKAEDFPPLALLGCQETQLEQVQAQLRLRYARLEKGDPQTKPISDLERGVIRGIAQRSTLRDGEERWAWCELPPDFALCAAGATMGVAEAWQRCSARLSELPAATATGPAANPGIDPEERRRRALRHAAEWTGAVVALERDLTSHGGALPEAEWRRFAVETLGRGSGRDASLAFQVLPGLGLPSSAAFATYAWLRESYSRRVLGEIGRAEIQAALAECNAERVTGSVDVDVLLFAAYDFAHGHPLPEERAAVRERAAACHSRLQQGASFDALLDELSEFADLRMRTQLLTGEQALAKTKRGRLGAQAPQTLKLLLGSTPFDLMTGGVDLAREVLEKLPVGEVVGPLDCTFGTCFVRINARALGAPPLNLERPAEIALARESLLAARFERWILDVRSRAGIEVR